MPTYVCDRINQTNCFEPNQNMVINQPTQGYLHVLKYHRAVSRFDFFLRSAHHQDLTGGAKAAGAIAPPPYREIGHHIKGDVTKAMIIQPKPSNWARR